MFEGRHIDYQSSKVDTSITDLRRSTHRSSVFEGQHIHLRRATHRSSNGNTSIFESRHINLRKSTHRSSKIEGGNTTPIIRRQILSTTALLIKPRSHESGSNLDSRDVDRILLLINPDLIPIPFTCAKEALLLYHNIGHWRRIYMTTCNY